MSLGSAITSVTRPLRAKVKPATIVAEHRMRAVPAAALVAAPSTPALLEPGSVPIKDPHGDYMWGVKWPGHSIKDTPDVDVAAIKEAFKMWKIFSLGGPELWGGLLAQTAAIAADAMPKRKH
mmetsp:Transcript_121084/g.302162  ORF Transcript_121084/g.302162 Transcript_121084/m.302162 type:complete len:122 (+) Transcript_121084:106-471(+)